ncbi:MAG: PepSY-associated TM helix domain-containing protein [Polyangiaceae bacterium]
MKLHRRTFQIFWDVHAWAGVLAALLLYLMFFAAAFALFHSELDEWAEPRSAPAAQALPRLQPLFLQLVREQHALERTSVGFSIHDTTPTAQLRGPGREEREFRYAPRSQRLEPLRSKLGSFLYELHFLDPIPYGIYVAGVAALVLFLALVTGVLIHLKDLIRQWFQFRPAHATRTWSSDMHKVLGVFGLPFQLFYAWSGAVLCLAYVTVQPVFVAAVFRGDIASANAARGDSEEPPATGKRASELPDLDRVLGKLRALVPGVSPEYVAIQNPGDEACVVTVYGTQPQLAFSNVEVSFHAKDARVLHSSVSSSGAALQRFEAWFYGLHYAQFGGYGVKWLYALLALGTCAVIVTGNLVWLERRDRTRSRPGNRLLQRLTVGFCSGVPLAVAALFVANRCLPAELSRRASVEQAVFWFGLTAALIWPFWARTDRRVAGQQLVLAGALFASALFVDLSLRQPFFADSVQRGVACGLSLLAVSCLAAGTRLLRVGSLQRPSKPNAATSADSGTLNAYRRGRKGANRDATEATADAAKSAPIRSKAPVS